MSVVSSGLPVSDWREFFRKDGVWSHPKAAWIVLVLSLCLTWFAWHISSNAIEKRLRDMAAFEATDIGIATAKRIAEQERVLRAGVGLFTASESVSREEFRLFVETIDVENNYPGLQGYGYSEVVKPEDVETHLARVRAEGFPDYAIKPAGERPLYTSIIYLEPFDWRNKRAFGYDMFSQTTRRAAMERARDTGEPAMTKAVTLVQETKEDVQRGFLLYLPVYATPEVPETVEERRDLLRGFVYSPFRMNDLMKGVLGTSHANTRLRIFDGNTLEPEHQLYDSAATREEANADADGAYQIVKVLNFRDRAWTLEITPDLSQFGGGVRAEPWFIGIGGIAIDLLVFYLISSISQQTVQARSLAEGMTHDLRQYSQRARQVLDNVNDGIITTDANGHIQTINPAGNDVFGWQKNEAVGTNLLNHLPEARSLLSDASDRSGKSGRGSSLELSAVHQAGHSVTVSVSAAPLPESDGEVWTWVVRDITERKKVEKIQSEFIAVVSHELRTPLTALSASLGILAKAPAMGKDQVNSLLSLAHRNAQRLTLLVNDILDMEKFKSNKIDYKMQAVDLVSTLGHSVFEHLNLAERSDCELKLECDLDSAFVLADEHRLKQILSNLISNAVKFSRAGTEVVVEVKQTHRGYRIAVTDQGMGIAHQHRRKVFESFYQVDALDRPEHHGTGLGLPIAQEIAKAHRSRIYLRSREGQGSTFFFTLGKLEILQSQENSPTRKKVLDTEAVAV